MLNWTEMNNCVFMSSLRKIFQGNSWTNSSLLYPCKLSLSICIFCIMLIKMSGYDRCRSAVFFSPLSIFKLLRRLCWCYYWNVVNIFIPYVLPMSVKHGVGVWTGVCLFFKERYFRVRVRVRVKVTVNPNPAPIPAPTRTRILHHSWPWKRTKRF